LPAEDQRSRDEAGEESDDYETDDRAQHERSREKRMVITRIPLDRSMGGDLNVATGRQQWNRASDATDGCNPVICRDTWARSETARMDVSGHDAGPLLALLLSRPDRTREQVVPRGRTRRSLCGRRLRPEGAI
jgi:hypothetical protein